MIKDLWLLVSQFLSNDELFSLVFPLCRYFYDDVFFKKREQIKYNYAVELEGTLKKYKERLFLLRHIGFKLAQNINEFEIQENVARTFDANLHSNCWNEKAHWVDALPVIHDFFPFFINYEQFFYDGTIISTTKHFIDEEYNEDTENMKYIMKLLSNHEFVYFKIHNDDNPYEKLRDKIELMQWKLRICYEVITLSMKGNSIIVKQLIRQLLPKKEGKLLANLYVKC